MNNIISIHSLRFFVLVFIQVILFNHINFYGYINPYPYILFIALFPIKNNRMAIIALSFLLGLSVDFFLDTGGIHAAACVLIAYIRPVILKFCFGTIYEHQTIKFESLDFGSKLTYFALLSLIHHFILFSLEIFNISKIILVLQKTLFSSIFTILMCLLITTIFTRKSK